MHNGMGVFKVDLDTGESVSYENNEFVYPEGVYGRECSTVDDHYTFGQCTVMEDAVTFRFEPTEQNESWTGTEFYFPPVWSNDADGDYRMAVIFNNTAAPDPALESYTLRCYMPDPNDSAPVGGPFIPDADAAAEIAEKERKAMEELGMLDPTPAP